MSEDIRKMVDKIKELEGIIIDLEFESKELKLKSNIYLATLQDIKHSCIDEIKVNEENIRFKLGDIKDVTVIENVLNYINEISTLYKIRI